MKHEYFSDRELGKSELKSEEISLTVYNGIIGCYKKYQKNFALNFPEKCPDNELICGTDVKLLSTAIKAQIPNMETPINLLHDEYDEFDKYALLDFIEFCYLNIVDIDEGEWHSFFRHYHFTFPKTKIAKDNFLNEVNQIFARNGIIFYLDNDGMVKRKLPTQLDTVLCNLNVKSKDRDLNELVNVAIENIRKPKDFNRIIALEKIWDAFERLKTFYDPNNKKNSAKTLVKNIAEKTANFDVLLENEFITLTAIGNDYQIRHFEQNKIKITTMKQVDYLFYRMISLIDLCMDKVNNEL